MTSHERSLPERSPSPPLTSPSITEPSITKPLISVVIVNFNRRDDLREAIDSIHRQDYAPVEILVVDNASTDGSTEMLTAEFAEVKLLALDENAGMAGYSTGFEHASGEVIFQMDNDSLMPDSGVLAAVVRRFAEGPADLAAVACRVEEFRPESDDIELLRGRDQRHGPLDTGGFHSGGVGFRRALLRGASYPREVFLYGSELFLQMILLERGYRVFFFPEILMLHKSSGVARSSLGVYFELRNRYWFMRRFAHPTQQLRFFPFMILYDLIYALARQQPKAFAKALRDGFAPMPGELAQPLRSPRPKFRQKVDEVGRRFGPVALLRSLVGGFRGQARP